MNGESHYYLGRCYRLRVVKASGPCRVELRGETILHLHARRNAPVEQRTAALQRWYRKQMQPLVPPLVEKWEHTLRVQVAEWGESSG